MPKNLNQSWEGIAEKEQIRKDEEINQKKSLKAQARELRERLAEKRKESVDKIEYVESDKDEESSEESDASQGDGGISMNTTQIDSDKKQKETNFKERISQNLLDVSQMSTSKGDFYELDKTVDLIRQFRHTSNGFTRVKHLIVYEKKVNFVKVQFKAEFEG